MHADLAALQGIWRVAALEVDGAPMTGAMLADAEIRIEGDQFSTSGMGAAYVGTMRLEPETQPRGFSLHFTDGPEGGRANHGIYELTKTGWRLCLNMTGGRAPRSFATTPGSGCALERLERKG